jgi:DNA-binding transcriptional ArsR family regulator
LSDILEMPQSSVSSHVQVIRKAGLLESERREKWTYFRIQERYLELLRHLEASFPGTEDPVRRQDDEKASKRLEERESSCCPGPVKLASRTGQTSRSCDQVGAG